MSEVASAPVLADQAEPQTNNSVQDEQQKIVPMTAPQQPELHRACAEGNMDDLRAALARGEALESLDLTTGCTPIVLAIQNGHLDVVRELLTAGAIVPPPGLTNDPAMLSVLYPQPIYGIPPPPFLSAAGMGVPPPFYPQPGFYSDGQQQQPQSSQQQQQRHMYPAGVSGPGGVNGIPNGAGQPGLPAGALVANGATVNGVPSNLPPADVAKSIPCRNFPNCKYGSACVFFHPNRPGGPTGAPGASGVSAVPAPPTTGVPPFYPSFVAQGQEGGFVPYQNGGAPFYPPEFVNSIQNMDQSQQQPESTEAPSAHVPSALTPAFIPSAQSLPHPPNGAENYLTSPPTVPAQFGLSPLSPSLMASPPPHMNPADFFATSPPSLPGAFGVGNHPNVNMGNLVNGGFAPRRQSFGQFASGKPFNPSAVPCGPGVGVGGGPSGHGKKPSFSGPKPWAAGTGPGGPAGRPPSAHLGTWKDGNPPPCAFFREGKCRNGEFCKFPHLDAEGNDCRHPDVIRGLIAPVPTRSRPVRMLGGPNGHFDPTLRQQQFVNKTVAAANANASAPVANNASSSTPPSVTAPNAVSAPSTVAEGVPATIPESSAAAEEEVETQKSSESTPASAAATEPKASETIATSTATPTTTTAVANTAAGSSSAASNTLPAKPVSFSPNTPIVRSASQPGVARVHASGHASRTHSPAGSKLSFSAQTNSHVNGFSAQGIPNGNANAHGVHHPGSRRNGSTQRFANGNGSTGMNGSRSSSAGPDRRANGHAHAHANGGSAVNHGHGHHNNNRHGGANGSSAATPAPAQRIPGADEFPALANGTGSTNGSPHIGGTVTPNGAGNGSVKVGTSSITHTPSSERREPSWGATLGGKTAAQVLSEPAPPRPIKPVPTVAPLVVSENADINTAANVTMDSDTEADTVIVSKAPSPVPPVTEQAAAPSKPTTTTSTPAVAGKSALQAQGQGQRPPVSFASVAGTAPAAVIATVEAAPVALKA